MAGPSQTDRLAEEQLRQYEEEKGKRDGIYGDDWQYISNYFLPQESNIQTQKTEGVQEWTQDIFDTCPIEAAQVYAAGDYNWLTPPQQQWAGYAVPREKGKEVDDAATRWLADCTDDVMAAFARSNFYSVRALNALGIGVFGTDFMLFEEDEKTPGEFNFRHNRIGTYTAAEDYAGIVDSTRREFNMTYRQIKQMFDKKGDTIPDDMMRAAKGPGGGAKKFKILHSIFPREDSDRLPGRRDGANKPIASVYIAMEFKKTIRVSGYEEQPCIVPRYAKWGTDSVWGYGPAYLTLPEARELNYMAQYMDSAAEKLIDPRFLVPSNLDGDVDLRAGGGTVYDENMPNALPKEWLSGAEYKLGLEIMDQKREMIRNAFSNPAFKLLNSDPLLDKKMTAFEISQRQAENLSGITPSLARRTTEFINVTMRRAFGIRYRAGKFGPPPQSLMRELGNGRQGLAMPEVVVTSRISDAMKALKNRGIEETVQFVAPIAKEKPELWDVFTLDDLVTTYAQDAGVPADLIRPKKGKDSVEQMRAARAKIQAEQRQAQMAEQLGKAGAGLGKSPEFIQDAAKQAAGARN